MWGGQSLDVLPHYQASVATICMSIRDLLPMAYFCVIIIMICLMGKLSSYVSSPTYVRIFFTFGNVVTKTRFRRSSSSTIQRSQFFSNSTAKPSVSTSWIAMPLSHLYSFSTRCAFVGSIPSNPSNQPSPMTPFGKIGSCRIACLITRRVLSDVIAH